MKKITSLIVALIFTIVTALAVINTAVSSYTTTGHSYARVNNPAPPPPPQPGGVD